MAATKSQGKSFTLFTVGLTVAAAGLAFIATGLGKVALIAGLIILVLSLTMFFKIKPQEGAPAATKQPTGLILGGLAVVVAGWVVVLLGLNLTSNVSGRMATTLIGLVVSLVGILVVLPMAANRNAIWKA